MNNERFTDDQGRDAIRTTKDDADTGIAAGSELLIDPRAEHWGYDADDMPIMRPGAQF